MSRRTSNKKVKQQILSYLNRNIPKGEVKFGYYCLSDSHKSYCLRKGGVPHTLSAAVVVSHHPLEGVTLYIEGKPCVPTNFENVERWSENYEN